MVRSSMIGVFVGILPAAGSTISNILAYDQAKKASKKPERFGTGCVEGIVAPESANNATAGGTLIVMMALGIPGEATWGVQFHPESFMTPHGQQILSAFLDGVRCPRESAVHNVF